MRPARTIALVVLLALGLPAAAQASGDDVISDCTKHGTLTRTYPQKDYKNALAHLPADVDEYGDCRNVIRDAQLAGATKGSGGGGGGGVAATASFRTPARGDGPAASGTGGTKAGSSSPSGGKGDDPNAVDPEDSKASNPSTADENQALIDATKNGGGAVKVGEDAIAPGAQSSSQYTQDLPAPITGVLCLLGIAGIVGSTLAIRRKLRAQATND